MQKHEIFNIFQFFDYHDKVMEKRHPLLSGYLVCLKIKIEQKLPQSYPDRFSLVYSDRWLLLFWIKASLPISFFHFCRLLFSVGMNQCFFFSSRSSSHKCQCCQKTSSNLFQWEQHFVIECHQTTFSPAHLIKGGTVVQNKVDKILETCAEQWIMLVPFLGWPVGGAT